MIANTVKGKGISFIADKNGWHGKGLTLEQYKKAMEELGALENG
jgi:transketolase